MKITQVKEVLSQYNFTEKLIGNIAEIFSSLVQAGLALEEGYVINTGGGCHHFYFQLASNRWVWFHGASQDITVSEPFDTAAQVEEAFVWNGEKVLSLSLSNYINFGETGFFEPVQKIVQDIKEENFYDNYAEKQPDNETSAISLKRLLANEELSIDHSLNAVVDKRGRYVAQAFCLGEDSDQITQAEADAYLKVFAKAPQMFNLMEQVDTALATLAVGIQSDLSPQAQLAITEVWAKIRSLKEELK